MNRWSSRRKRIIFFLVLFALAVLVGVPTGFLVYEPPTCFDGKHNGEEGGVDCGGSCELICRAETLPLIAEGDPRVLEVTPGFVDVVVLLENPNPTAEVERARYTIKLFETPSITPIATIEGETFIPRGESFVVFEGPISTGEARPTRATLEWGLESLVWKRSTATRPNMRVSGTNLSYVDGVPRVYALLENRSEVLVEDVELISLIRDQGGNLTAASKTFVEEIKRGESVPVVFSWLQPFGSETVGVDVVWQIKSRGSLLR